MKTLGLFFIILGASMAAQSVPCGQTAIPIVSGVTTTSYIDSTTVDGQAYFYTVAAKDSNGNLSTCATIPPVAVIPNTGTHTVSLNWTASTTSGVTYSVFRAQAPAPPTNLTVTVN